MVRIVVRGPTAAVAEQFADHIAQLHREAADRLGISPRVLGPAAAPIPRIRGQYRFHILVYHAQRLELLALVRDATSQLKAPADVIWTADLDPIDML